MEATRTKWIKVDELTDRLAISKSKAYELANDGSLDAIRIGRSLRVSEESLNRWLESMVQARALEGDAMK